MGGLFVKPTLAGEVMVEILNNKEWKNIKFYPNPKDRKVVAQKLIKKYISIFEDKYPSEDDIIDIKKSVNLAVKEYLRNPIKHMYEHGDFNMKIRLPNYKKDTRPKLQTKVITKQLVNDIILDEILSKNFELYIVRLYYEYYGLDGSFLIYINQKTYETNAEEEFYTFAVRSNDFYDLMTEYSQYEFDEHMDNEDLYYIFNKKFESIYEKFFMNPFKVFNKYGIMKYDIIKNKN